MKSKLFRLLLLLVIVAGTFFYCSYMRSQFQILTGETMNTYYRITLREGREDTLLQNEIKEELQQINNEMSVFEHLSDISQFNRNTDTGWIDIPDELAVVLKEAYRVYQQTNGYFDPSVGKLVDLWGFGTNKVHRIPLEEEILEAKKSVGFNKISFSKDYKKAKKSIPDIYINLSSIAKGYGVDRIAKLLEKKGYQNYIVEIGGEVRAKGIRAPKAAGWNLGIARPESDSISDYEYVVSLKDMSVATSGDYRNYFYVEGKRYSHTLNPKTGYPVEHNLASVTVFDKECMRADALATGIMSMGETKGFEFVNNNRIPAILFVKTDETYQVLISNEAKKILANSLTAPKDKTQQKQDSSK